MLVLGMGTWILSGCQSLQTNLSVPNQPLPGRFQTLSDSAGTPAEKRVVAMLPWRDYFGDTLLTSLIDTALARNTNLQIALQRIEQFRAGIRAARGARLPQAGLVVGGDVRKFGLYTMDGAGNITTEITPGQIVPIHLPDMYLGVQASWEADAWGKLKNQRKSALAQYLASSEGANLIRTNLIAEVATLYYQLLALDNELDIIRQTVESQQQAVQVVESLKGAGRENQLAVHQFNAQWLGTQALEKELLQAIAETENQINFLLGRYPQPIGRKREQLFDNTPVVLDAGIPSDLLQNRPDIRQAALQLQATHFDLLSAKAAFLPSFTLTAGYGFQAFNPEFLFRMPASVAYSALGSLVTPLVNRNALKAQFSSARATQLEAMYTYQQTILNGYAEVSNQISLLSNLSQIQQLKKRQAGELQQAIQTANDLYRTGRVSYLDVLIAQQSSLQTRLDLIATSRRQQMASVNLYRALGGGWR